MTNASDDLGKKIEQLVAEHIAATRRTVKEAIERGFAAAGVPVAATRAPKSEQKERVRSSGERKRRGTAALAELGERF